MKTQVRAGGRVSDKKEFSLKLTVTLSGRALDTEAYDGDVEMIRVGRDDACELRIDNIGISRFHCEIKNWGYGFYRLKDLGSGNGTFVNAKRVKFCNLNHGDKVSLGKYTITVTLPPTEAEEGSQKKAARPKPSLQRGGGGAERCEALARRREEVGPDEQETDDGSAR